MDFYVATAFEKEDGTPLLVQVSEEAYYDLLRRADYEDEDVTDTKVERGYGNVTAHVLLSTKTVCDALKELLMQEGD